MVSEDDFYALSTMLLAEELRLDPDLPQGVLAYWTVCRDPSLSSEPAPTDSGGDIPAASLESVRHPYQYCPVTDLKVQSASDGKAEASTSTSHHLYPLRFSVCLDSASKTDIHFDVTSEEDAWQSPEVVTVSSDDRNVQAALTKAMRSILDASVEEELPLMYIYTALHEYFLALASSETAKDDKPVHSGTNSSTLSLRSSEEHQASLEGRRIKTALLWSHHLLATSKRKDLQHWSTELGVWTLAKIGYPGVMILQGVEADVNEFVRRIKALQWYALQVRYEESELHVFGSVEEAAASVQECDLAKAVLAEDGQKGSKPCSRETDSMSELAALMTSAGMRDIFATSMKLPT